jgi:transcriptional regulator with XRE-family HTH domain
MENFDTNIFCERAIALFGDSGQMELAEKIGISQGVISAIKNKKVKAPGADTIYRLSKCFGVSSDYLLGLSDAPTTDADLRAVCEYTGLSQAAIEYIREIKEIKDKHQEGFGELCDTLSQILENNNFWMIYEMIREATEQGDLLLPHAESLLDIGEKALNGDELTSYDKILFSAASRGLAPMYKYEISEYASQLFSEITRYKDRIEKFVKDMHTEDGENENT